MKNDEAVERLKAQALKLTKIKGEITKLKNAILTQGDVSPEVQAGIEGVDRALQETDDMNEDETTE